MRYCAGPRDDYLIRPVDDLTLVYHRPAGITHVVAPVIAAILDVLCGAEMTAAEVAVRLAERHSFETGEDDVRAAIAARLDEMASLDLLDRIG